MEQDKITVKMNYCINPLMAQHVHLGGEFSIKEGQTAEQAWGVALDRIEEFFKTRFPQSVSEMKGGYPADIDGLPIIQGSRVRPSVLLPPDDKIKEQYRNALEKRNEQMIKTLESIYDLKPKDNAVKK